jgi:hypothetical protein
MRSGSPHFNSFADWAALCLQHGPIFKLAFGPKAFVVISDPIIARYILKENTFGYDKVGATAPLMRHFGSNVLTSVFPVFRWSLSIHHVTDARPGGLRPAPKRYSDWRSDSGRCWWTVQGVLADILEPIMGKGLIPADLETWKGRRRGKTPSRPPAQRPTSGAALCRQHPKWPPTALPMWYHVCGKLPPRRLMPQKVNFIRLRCDSCATI